jgi:phosphodiesterase/alkaline phosphatase D-like protein
LYDNKTSSFEVGKDLPVEADLSSLSANTRYYYRTRYRKSGSADNFSASSEHTFHTQRASGSTFTFTVEADEHLYDKKGVRSIYQVCLGNQANDRPDFMISLGDIFGDDHNPFTITSSQIDYLHMQYRPYLGTICHSVPFFVCLGNHEGENDFYLAQTPPENLAVKSTLSRKLYYPNPFPNAFYSGNQDNEPYGMGNPENYYAWTWGDALFVVLDVYRYENPASTKPTGWNWTLGTAQYEWLKNTLESSHSKYKFVFAHHIRGQGRGGVTNAKLFEWGGYEQDGVTFNFPSKRPGWAKPIHKLFVDNGVDIFFQGHDHVFSHEMLDGVTYQAVPMPSDSTYQIGILANGAAYTSDVVAGEQAICAYQFLRQG